MQFNVNEWDVGGSNGETIAISLRESNLYQITFTKVGEAYVANLVRLSMGIDLIVNGRQST